MYPSKADDVVDCLSFLWTDQNQFLPANFGIVEKPGDGLKYAHFAGI